MRVADIQKVIDLKKSLELEESIVIITYKGKLLKDSDKIMGKIEYGDILDV
jgi:hypothetical protein